MQRSGRIKKNKASVIAHFATSTAIAALWLSLLPAQANGAPGPLLCGTQTPNGNGGIDYFVGGSVLHTCPITNNDTLTVINSGAVIVGGAGGNGVNASGTPTSIVNDGLISASEMFKAAIDNSGVLGSIVNTGTIEGVGSTSAVENSGTIGLLNNNSGLITSGGSAIHNTGALTITNNGGIIESPNFSNAIYSSPAGVLHLDNTNGLITSQIQYDTVRITGSGGTINNTNGTIQAQTGSALLLSGPLGSPLINTGGLLASASNDDSEGTVDFQGDMGDLTVAGGTIINTDTTSNDRVAVSVNNDQTGVITFDGVTILADGTGVAQGYAIYIYEYDASINLTASTFVRGQIYVYCCGFMHLTTSGTIIGDITGEGDADIVTVNGGSITGNIALLGDDDVFTLNAGTVTGTVDMGNGGNTVALNGGVLNGNVIFAAGNDVFTYTGGVLNGDINFGTGFNTLNVDGMWAPTGAITTSGGATALNVGSTGYLILNNDVNLQAGQIDVAENGRLYLQGGDLTGSIFENHGTTQIGVDRTLTIGVFDNSAQGTLVFDTRGVNNLMKTGKIDAFESHSDLNNQIVEVNYLGGALTLESRSLIVAGGDTAILPSAPLADNSIFYNFGVQVDPNNPDDIYLILTEVKTVEDVASSPANARTANVLLKDLEGSNDPVIQQIQQKLSTASSAEEFNQIIKSTQQTVDQGNQVAAVGMTGAMFDLADGQLAMVNSGGGTGVGAGNELKGLHFWSQGFGGRADQGFRNGTDGYEADARGVAMGVDTRNFHRDTVVGVSLGFAGTDVSSDNANNTRTDVKSYQLMAYGNHELGGDSFVTGMALYGWNDNDQTRFNVGGIPGVNAFSEYGSWVGGARGSVGHNFRFPRSDQRASLFMLTPQLFSEYVNFSRDAYTETGAGGANIVAGDAGQTILNLGVSLQAEWTIATSDGGKLQPDIHISYKYDAIGDAADTTSTFVAGGSTIGVEGVDPAQSAFGVGAGVKFFDTSGWDFIAAYDYTFKDEYQAHSAYLRAAYGF